MYLNGENPIPSGASGHLVGSGNGDLTPETGIIGTPVIDRNTNTAYVVTASVVTSRPTFYQRLHALDLTSGAEKTAFNSPATVAFSGFNPQTELQRTGLALVNGVVYICCAFHTLYIASVGGPLQAFALNPSTSQFATNPAASSSVLTAFVFPGATPSISANGTKACTTLVWALNNSQYCTPNSPGCGPVVLYAYDANLNELWDSTMVSGDAAGNAAKFTVPTVQFYSGQLLDIGQ